MSPGLGLGLGLGLNRNKGGGVSGPILFDDFSTYASTQAMIDAGWANGSIGSGSISLYGSGALAVTGPDGSNQGFAIRSLPTEIGAQYSVKFSRSGGAVAIRVGSTVYGTQNLGTSNAALGLNTFTFTATATTTYLHFINGVNTVGLVDNVQVDRIS